MIEAIQATARRGADLGQAVIGGLLARAEGLVSHRGLAIGFLLGAAVLATAGWLRPPLSPDIRSFHLPLGMWEESGTAEPIVRGPRHLVPESPGIVLMVILVVGFVLVLRRPQRLGMVAGILLVAALAGNAATALNHPALIERLDHEYEQRRQIAGVSAESPEGNPMSPEEYPMADPYNGRIGLAGAPTGDEQAGDLARGWVYLLYGIWLIPYCAAAVLLASPAPRASQRWVRLGLWVLLGIVLAAAACGRRLAAEYYWERARSLEGACDAQAARDAVQTAIRFFPELERLERTWLLLGKLDYLQGRHTLHARLFHAHQLARDKTRPRAVCFREDIPWSIARTNDYREGLVSLPAGYDLTLQPGVADVGARDNRRGHYLQGLITPGTTLFVTYWYAQAWEPLRATFLMDEVLAAGGDRHAALRNEAGRLWTNAGLQYYLRGELLTDEGLVYSEQNLRLSAAEAAWRRAAELDPDRFDCAFYLGTVAARVDRSRPERAQEAFQPLLDGCADRALRADILNIVGDAYFEASRMSEARRRYVESFDVFNMPGVDKINYRAQRRLGGL